MGLSDIPHTKKNGPTDKTHRWLQTGVVLFGIVVLLFAWGVILFQFDRNKKGLLKGLRREQANLASVFSENLFQALEQKQAIKLFALQWLADGEPFHLEAIADFLGGNHSFTRVAIYTPSGATVYQSSPPDRNQQDAWEIAPLINELKTDRAPLRVVWPSETSQTPLQTLLLFPLYSNDTLKGAMLMELDLGFFLNLSQNISIGKTGNITLYTDKEETLARFESGGIVAEKGGAAPAYTGTSESFSGSSVVAHPVLGAYQITRRHLRDYPFVVAVGQSLDEFFSGYDRYKARFLWTLSLLTAFCLAGLYFLYRMFGRTHRYVRALSDSNVRNEELIRKLEEEHQIATHAASYDALTNLYNRRLFVFMARKNLLQAKRNRFTYALLFIDLDRFKTINDTLGHRVGDLLLAEVARRLEHCTRDADVVGRLGGDEFVVMLTELTAKQNLSLIVEKIISEISRPYEDLEGYRVITSPSIGVAVYPQDGQDLETLLRNADAAMYRAKKSGRGRHRFFDPSLNTISVQEFELEQGMPAAIADEQFVLHYQPKIRLRDYRVVGLEALVRWHHPEHQLIFPSDFIEIAEKTGLIVDLGQWCIKAACRQLTRWRSEGMNLVPIAVNVSPLELKNNVFKEIFLSILDQYRIPTDLIEIEITENALIEEKDVVIENLQGLHARGVKVYLDDFGKGFSSFDHIRCLPIAALKIDRSFIQDIRSRHMESPIVSSTIILAKKLGMTVVAEGVETTDQLVNLRIAGCDQVQGYYFSRPVPAKKIRGFILTPERRISA